MSKHKDDKDETANGGGLPELEKRVASLENIVGQLAAQQKAHGHQLGEHEPIPMPPPPEKEDKPAKSK